MREAPSHSAARRGLTLALASTLACASYDSTRLGGADAAAPDALTAEACPAGAEPGALGRSAAALSVVDRSLVGSPARYAPDPSLRAREHELRSSQRARRAAAWDIAARVLAPVRLPGGSGGGRALDLRAWQTWHNEDDITRLFRRLYAGLTPEERQRRAPFAPAAIAEAWAWNDGAVADFEAWSAERLAEYRSALDSAAKVAGVGGIARVAHAPATSLHWLASYGEVLGCRRGSGRLDPAEPVGAAPLESGLREAELREAELREAELREAELRGSTGGEAGACPEPPFEPACLAGQFAPESVLVKASWARLDAGSPVHAFDTSAAALDHKLSAAGGFDWGPGDRPATPGEQEMYTLELPSGNRFGLTGLHIMSKELEHWFWVTLWWSDTPDEDFGADRPDGLPPPFDHYKLCSVVWFEEGDAEPGGGFEGDAPSLAAALARSGSGVGQATWCSNPYIERGPGNAATNCIGCHQHAGTALSTEQVLAASEPASGSGRRRARATFPSDYAFSSRRGDDLGAMFVETEDHYVPGAGATPAP